MTIEQFGDATHYEQENMVKCHGRFLLEKTVGTNTSKLFALDHFYVEINYCFLPYSIPLIRCLSIEEIDEYLSLINLSDMNLPLGLAE